ncbi:hypothetical protein [Candidatus Neptunochlamydia vexilliferae]|uniref:hypothetical protein n=1 Tax=Candidatus Neptunichlamydia vexilliferae TaxID=1651774 RepID=UPI001891CDFF|nr:hypothetical protein [Candidatus Neptunochlamydia vexilliferae]
MDITNYTAYFHDGNLIDIEHQGKNIYLFLESAQLPISGVSHMSKSKTLLGKLCLIKVQKVIENDEPYVGLLNKKHDSGEILDLELEGNKVLLLVEWTDYPPKPRVYDVSEIIIESEKVYWEPLKDL